MLSTHELSTLNFLNGGIAQLVERQLCKLDVRGSSPLASTDQLRVDQLSVARPPLNH